MEETAKLRVLIVEGVPLIRFALGSLTGLHPRLEVCSEVGDAPAARQACVKEKPDLIVLDLAVPRGDGLALLREFGRLHPGARVLVVSAEEDSLSVERAFRAGARGYVTSKDEGAELLAGLECVLSGRLFASPRVSQFLLEGLAGKRAPKSDAQVESLSNREQEIFRLMGSRMGATAIGRELGVSVKTVETHQRRMKKKLHLASSAALHERAEVFHGRPGTKGGLPASGKTR